MVSRQTVERARDLRRRLTPPEARLWVRLRREQLRGFRFRRQHPVGPYVLDFYCAEAKLAVEVDGQSHDHPDRIAHDRRRTAWLATQGIRVIRLAAEDVRVNLDGVLEFIARTALERCGERRRSYTTSSTPPPLRGPPPHSPRGERGGDG
ncbi:endonuclease domain-containing protein [Brevundimonas sp.]